MNKLSNALTAMAIAAISLSGTVEAREHERGDRTYRDGARAEQRAGNGNRERRETQRQSRRDSNTRDNRSTNRVDRRQANQRTRIRDARHEGDLSRREAKQLRKDQRKISRMERRFGGDEHFSPRERRRLEHTQDRASRRIARARDNDHPHYRPRKDRYQGYRGSHRGHDHHDLSWSRPSRRHGHRHDDNGSVFGIQLILDGLTASWYDWDDR